MNVSLEEGMDSALDILCYYDYDYDYDFDYDYENETIEHFLFHESVNSTLPNENN